MITITENDKEMIVSGQYKEMVPIISKLKSRKFYYESSDKTWRIDIKLLTDVKRKNLAEFLPITDEAKKNLADKQEEEIKQKTKDADDFVNKCKNFKIIRAEKTFNSIQIYGDVFSRKDELRTFGFSWNSTQKSYDGKFIQITNFDKVYSLLEKIDDKLYDEFIKYEKQKQEKYNELIKIDKKIIGNAIRFEITKNTENSFLNIYSSDKKYRDVIKQYFPTAKWEGYWTIKVQDVNLQKIDDFEKGVLKIIGNELKDAEKSGSYDYVISCGSGYGGEPYQEKTVIKNKKSNIDKGQPIYLYVLKAEKTYFKEDGLTFGVGDDSGYIYYAYCREATDDESREIKEEEIERMNKQTIKNRIKEIINEIDKKGTYPQQQEFPSGKKFEFEKNLIPYGGGYWIVIQNDKVWYIHNNGADGDNWSHNNITSNGSAGAIGKFIVDEEIAIELEDLLNNI